MITFTNWRYVDDTRSALVSTAQLNRDGFGVYVPCIINITDILNNDPMGVASLMNNIMLNAKESLAQLWEERRPKLVIEELAQMETLLHGIGGVDK